MGAKHGKYSFEHESLPSNGKQIVPLYLSESKRIFKHEQAFVPKCIHRDLLVDPLATNLDHLSLVWLDTDVFRRTSNIDTEVKLKNIIHYIRLFDRVDACERYIKQIGKMNNYATIKKEQLFVIISTTLAPTLIPHLHDLPQVKYIYIYGKSKSISKAHQEWLSKYNKVKGVFNSSRSLIAQLSQDRN